MLFATIDKPGRATADVLAEAIPAIVRAFPWPKSMRWGEASLSTESLRWVRPLQGIVALLGEEIVAFEIAGMQSGAATVGHRFHHPGAITIGGAGDYVEKLRACHVIVDHGGAQGDHPRAAPPKLPREAGLTLVADEGLVAENAGLTEWPVPLLGKFDPAFLDVPPEVIQLTMRVNQKYFACQDEGGKLATALRLHRQHRVAATPARRSSRATEKVLAARLSDAKFFWEQDLKVPLAEHGEEARADRLPREARHRRRQGRAGRQARRSGWSRSGSSRAPTRTTSGRPPASPRPICVTELVGEFPELQGIIGSYYARAQGQPDAVADAIRDHYKPAGQGDDVPTDPVTVAVNIADRLDTLVAFFSIGERPTGSRDPFALRRAALGFLQILTRLGPAPAAQRRAGPGGGAAHRLADGRAVVGDLPGPARHGRP